MHKILLFYVTRISMYIRLAKANFHFKSPSRILNLKRLSGNDNETVVMKCHGRLEHFSSDYREDLRILSHCFLYNESGRESGNLVQYFRNKIDFSYSNLNIFVKIIRTLLRYTVWYGMVVNHGGKTAKKAKALSNFKDNIANYI